MKESITTKPEEKTKIEENKNDDLLEEFKKEVFFRDKTSIGKISLYITLILVIFSLLGIASYQIFFKPETLQEIKSEEKIESRPEPVIEEPQTPVATEEPKVETPQPTVVTYTVQEGDTWSSIANSNDMTSAELMQYNGTTDLNLQIGQIVKIPKN